MAAIIGVYCPPTHLYAINREVFAGPAAEGFPRSREAEQRTASCKDADGLDFK